MAIRYLSGINVDSNTLFVDDANNRVGIGTNSPSRQLELVGSDAYIQLTRSSTSTQATLGFNTGATNDWLIRTGDGSTSNLQFYSYGTSSYVMTIARSSGNVGIGTTAPAEKLQVSGNISITTETGTKIGFNTTDSFTAYGYSVAHYGISFPYGQAAVPLALSGYYGLGLFTNGAERMRVTQDGNVGIGTTSPSQKLHVQGNSIVAGQSFLTSGFSSYTTDGLFNANALWSGMITPSGVYRIRFGYLDEGGGQYWGRIGFVGNTNWSLGTSQGGNSFSIGTDNGNNQFLIDNAGNVGIGTSSPATKFVVSNAGASGLEVDPTGGVSSGVLLQAYNRSTSAYMAQSYYALSHTFNVGSGAATRAVDITSAGNVGIGTTSPNYKLDVNGSINIYSGNSLRWGSGDVEILNSGYSMLFSTYTGSALTEKMRITSAGNVGIGTTSPSTKLDVNGVGAFGTMTSSRGLYSNGLSLQNNTGEATSLFLWQSGVASAHIGSPANSTSLHIVNSYNTGLITDPNSIVLTNTGNVGIGTTAPGAKLEIAQNTDNTDGPTLRIANNANTLSNGQLIGAIDFYNGDDSGTGNAVGAFIRSFTADAVLPVSSQYLSFAAGGTAERMRIASTGATRLNAYGSGSFTGTVAYNLAVDSSGNIIETAGGVVDGSGTANYVSKWSDANTLTDSQLFDNGTNVGIGTSSPANTLQIGSVGATGYSGNRLAVGDGTNVVALHPGAVSYLTANGDIVIGAGGNTTNQVYVKSGGNVGIGTAAPDQLLHINAGASTAYIHLVGQSRNLYIGQDSSGAIMYSDGDAPMIFTTNASERMRITSAGRVGIATTDTNLARLRVIGEGGVGNAAIMSDYGNTSVLGEVSTIAYRGGVWHTLYVSESGSSATNAVYVTGTKPVILNAGNVGIGTTSPGSKLTIGGSFATIVGLTIDTGDGVDSAIVARKAASKPAFGVLPWDSSVFLSAGVYYDGGSWQHHSNDNNNQLFALDPSTGVRWYASNDGTPSWNVSSNQQLWDNNAFWTNIVRSTRAGDSYFTGGNVGIGTTAPTSKLYIEGGSADWNETTPGLSVGTIHLDPGTETNDYGNAITFGASDSGGGGNAHAGIYLRSDGNYGTKMYFATTDSYAVGSKTRMFINNNGNVGIGTTSPSYRLDVAGGDVRFVAAASTDALVRIIAANYATEYDARLFLGENDTNGMTIEYDGSNNVGFIGMNSSTDPTGAYSKRIRMSRDGSEVSFPVGNVGIGTTAPDAKLVIVTGSADDSGNSFSFTGYGSKEYVSISKLGFIRSRASDLNGANMHFIDNGGTNRMEMAVNHTSMTWYSHALSSTFMVFQHTTGNVGIGTTSPANKLVAVADATFNGENSYAIAAASLTDVAYKTIVGYDYANDVGVISAVRTGIGWKNLSILPVGNTNLGVGTLSPSERLHVSGNIRVTGAYYDSNNSAGSSGQVLSSTGSGTDWVSLSEITGVDGTGTANYIAKWSDTDTITNSQVFDNGTNVGINNASPKTRLDVNGAIGFGSKSMSMTDTFAAALTINMNDHNGCYVKITAFGDWSNHSTIAYLGEFFIQASAGAYNEPGIIIRQVDNTGGGDDIQAQILDPAGAGTRDFIIELKATSAANTPFTAYLQYEVRGLYNSVS